MLAGFSGTPGVSTVLIVLSEALPLIFVILRAPSATLLQRPTDWAAAITATIAPLLVRPNIDPAGAMEALPLQLGRPRARSVILKHAHFARHWTVVAHLLDVRDLVAPMQPIEVAGEQAVSMEI
jgi:hypothetical protein